MYIKQPSFIRAGHLVYKLHGIGKEDTKFELDDSVAGFEHDPADGDFLFVQEKRGRELVGPVYLWDWNHSTWVLRPDLIDPGDAYMYRSSPSDASDDDSSVPSEDASEDAADELETLDDEVPSDDPEDDEPSEEDAELDE